MSSSEEPVQEASAAPDVPSEAPEEVEQDLEDPSTPRPPIPPEDETPVVDAMAATPNPEEQNDELAATRTGADSPTSLQTPTAVQSTLHPYYQPQSPLPRNTAPSPSPSISVFRRQRKMSVSATVEVAVDPVALIINECITVTSAMRKNARWAQSSVAAILGGGMADSASETGSNAGSIRDGVSTPVRRGGTPTIGSGELAKRSMDKGPSSAGAGGREGKSGENGDAGKELGIEIGLAGRWGLRGKKGKSIQDNPLIAAFSKLRADMNECRDIRTFDTPALLHPFLQVIRSSSTSGPITSLALIAITKFFSYNIITAYSPRLALAMQLLSSAITHCRFEASDSAQDEVVLLRILKLMEGMMAGPGGELLGDESVCEMMETGLSMCCQMRLSEVLRRSAEMSMVVMCQVVFERLKHLGTDLEDADGDYAESTADTENLKMEPSVNGELSMTAAPAEGVREPSAEISHVEAEEGEEEEEIKPYSLPSIRELLRVLVSLLDPQNRQHTDTMRVMALRMIDVAFEVAGPSITMHPSLATLAHDDLCRYLFQLVRSDVMSILQESLRVTGTLLATSRKGLKLQQELFLAYVVTCLHPRVEIPRENGIDPFLYEGVPQGPKGAKSTPQQSQAGSGRSTPVPVKERQKLGMEGGARRPDAREAMVECVGALARIPSFMVELYVNYDCDVNQSDLCEDVIGFLSRNAFPDSATWSTTNVPPLCLDALLGIINFLADRLEDTPRTEGFPDPVKLQESRDRKQLIIKGAQKFNEDPKKGIAYFGQHGIIEDVNDPVCIAKFLKGMPRISKKMLGEYLTKKTNLHILDAFLELFDYSGKRVDEALRDLLQSFRLPGEAQLIERIVSTFSEKYYNTDKPAEVADKDAVFVLSYAIIMLNTDQHNPTVKVRMQLEDFAKNLRSCNNGQNFPEEYLKAIYDTIRTREIILPEEHDNQHAFDYAWKELLVKSGGAGELVLCNTNIFDAQMFSAIWKPVIATLSYVFMSATDDAVFTRVITGFDQCAQIAAKYNLTECFDRVVRCLSVMSTLATETPPSTTLNTEVQVSGNSVTVSEMAVRFGRDFKAQLAMVVLFRIVTGKEAVIRDGWTPIVRIWLNLFINSLIPPFFLTDQNGLDLPPIPLQTPAIIIDRNQASKDVGLFSTFASYLSSYAADDPPEPSDEELESTLSTVDCVNSCYLGDVFANVMQLEFEALKSLLKCLLATLPEANAPVVVIKYEAPVQPVNGPHHDRKDSPYDPAVVYVLELATCIAMRDAEAVEKLGPEVAEVLQSILNDTKNAHPLVTARTTYYLLTLLKASHQHDFLRTPVILHNLATMDKALLDRCSGPIVKGLRDCLQSSPSLKKEMSSSPNFWSLLRMLATNAEEAGTVFQMLEVVATETPSNVTADNYVAVVTLLNDFASAASIGAAYEQSQDKQAKQRGGKQAPIKPSSRPHGDVVDRGVKAVLDIYGLTPRATALIEQSHLERTEAWTTYWSPIFQALSSQCVNPCREVRHHSFSSLQRSLLSPELASHDHTEWTAIFGDVLFPLITTLLKPEVYQGDPRGMSETRVLAATLLCKIFLHYLVMLSEWEGMLSLWLKILDIMDRLMNSGQGHNLEEAVPESLKNILLVMMSGGYLVKPSEAKKGENPSEDIPPSKLESDDEEKRRELWTQTWKRLERFLPRLYSELYPEDAAEGKK